MRTLRSLTMPAGLFATSAFTGLLLINSVNYPRYGYAPMLLALGFGLSFIFIINDSFSKRKRPFRLISSLYFSFFLCLPAYFHSTSYGFPFYAKIYPKDDVQDASILVIIFLILFYFFYYINESKKATNRQTRETQSLNTSAMACIGFSFAGLFFASVFGWTRILTSRGDATSLELDDLIVQTLARQMTFISFIYSTTWRGSRPVKYLLVTLCTACFFATNFPLSIARFLLAAYALTFFSFYSSFSSKQRIAFVISMILGLVSIFPIISALSRGDISALLSTNAIKNYVTTGDFDGFQSIVNVIGYIDDTGFKLGRNVLSAALVFVPRFFWPGKSRGTGVDAATHAGYDYTNISAPLPAELYADFGYLGVFLGCYFLTRFMARGDRSLYYGAVRPATRVIVAALFGFMIIILRGSLVAIAAPIGLMIILMFAMNHVSRVLKGRSLVNYG